MRVQLTLGAIAVAALVSPAMGVAQAREHLNPMIALHEKGLPVFGIAHVSFNAPRGGGAGVAGAAQGGGRGGQAAAQAGGRGGAGGAAIAQAAATTPAPQGGGMRSGGAGAGARAATAAEAAAAAPAGAGRRGGGMGAAGAAQGAAADAAAAPAPPPLADVARETLAYRFTDFEYNSYSPASADRFMGYMAAIIAQGGGMREHAFIAKVPIVHDNIANAQARIIEQLNMGHAGIFMQEVESAAEVRQAIQAMRFRSKGGIRPEEGIGLAAAYWGLSKQEYLQRADVWPLNPNGELVVYAIVESREGIAKVREIAAEPGVAAVVVGAGTLGGVFSSTNVAGERVRDQVGFDAAVASVVAACKEFKVACSYPANNPADIQRLMGMGFTVFTMQSRNQAAFDAVETGRRLGGRPMTPR